MHRNVTINIVLASTTQHHSPECLTKYNVLIVFLASFLALTEFRTNQIESVNIRELIGETALVLACAAEC